MKLNKNYAGISFLYRKNGAVSTVMEIVMKEPVNGAMLQACVNFTVSRHPYFKSSLQERDGDYYIAENEFPFEVKETETLRPLGSPEVKYHLIDVTYSGNRICGNIGLLLLRAKLCVQHRERRRHAAKGRRYSRSICRGFLFRGGQTHASDRERCLCPPRSAGALGG